MIQFIGTEKGNLTVCVGLPFFMTSTDPAVADRLIAEGYCDYVVIARGFIADPDRANKARAGEDEDIRPCIRCFRCLDVAIGRVNTSTKAVLEDFSKFTRRSACSGNPTFGHTHGRNISRKQFGKRKLLLSVGDPVACREYLIRQVEKHKIQ